jgi:hypothetical protein
MVRTTTTLLPIMWDGNKAALHHHQYCHTNCLLNTTRLYHLYHQVTPTQLSISSIPCALVIQFHAGRAQCRTEILFLARTLRCPCNRHSTPNSNQGIKIRCPICLIGVQGHRTQVNINMELMRALSIREIVGVVNITMGMLTQMGHMIIRWRRTARAIILSRTRLFHRLTGMGHPSAREPMRHTLFAIILSQPGKGHSPTLHHHKFIQASRARVNTIICMQLLQMFWEWPLHPKLQPAHDLLEDTLCLSTPPVTPPSPDKTQQCRPVHPSHMSARPQAPALINKDRYPLSPL